MRARAICWAGLPVVRGRKVISLERQVRIAAGLLVVLGVMLGWLVHPSFLALSAFVGAGLIFAGMTDTCVDGTAPRQDALEPGRGVRYLMLLLTIICGIAVGVSLGLTGGMTAWKNAKVGRIA